MNDRLRAVCDLMVPAVREMAGRHEYDGLVQDLSPGGVARGLTALATGPPLPDPHDEAHLSVFENTLRVQYGELELHRRDPFLHLANLELSSYNREYAPPAERATARRRHLAQWPDAIDAAITSLDRVSAPVADALLDTVRAQTAGLRSSQGPVPAAALDSHARLVDHLAKAAETGDPDPRLGGPALAALMASQEGLPADLSELTGEADRERSRLAALLADSCDRLAPGRPVGELIPELMADHPGPGGVVAEATRLTREAIAFTRARNLAPHLDGECLVGPAPASHRWSMAMMTWAAPGEPDIASWYHVTPPGPHWPNQAQHDWLSVFNRTSFPAITLHEVAPGHFAHGRALRRAPGAVRRTLHSLAFCEGWAHYAEELCLEEGFRAGDPRFAIGVALEALVRVTRLTCAIGIHTGALTLEDATRLFARDAHLPHSTAVAEARRGAFDATYGRYTWGKLRIMRAREDARKKWESGFSLSRFHTTLLELGSPPLGLIGPAFT